MKDAFGRELKVGDVVIYATRNGSSQNLNVAVIKEIREKKDEWSDKVRENARVECVAGTGYDFTYGKSTYNGQKYESQKYEGRLVTLHASNNMMLANGIDVEGIKAHVAQRQQENMDETARRHAEYDQKKAAEQR